MILLISLGLFIGGFILIFKSNNGILSNVGVAPVFVGFCSFMIFGMFSLLDWKYFITDTQFDSSTYELQSLGTHILEQCEEGEYVISYDNVSVGENVCFIYSNETMEEETIDVFVINRLDTEKREGLYRTKSKLWWVFPYRWELVYLKAYEEEE